MGYAVAKAAEKRGASVTLVSGPVHLETPVGVTRISVESCDEMAAQMMANLPDADIIIKVAAVADYKPMEPKNGKIKKKEGHTGLALNMVENQDILKLIGEKKTQNQFLVGFAAETEDLEKNAVLKIKKKNLDMIAANLVGSDDSGFKADTNKVKLIFRDGSSSDLPLMKKEQVADLLITHILDKMR
jgi:phosphopantothenoylcysteine decarboxylase/phosphopantothenate--cysteine ligase